MPDRQPPITIDELNQIVIARNAITQERVAPDPFKKPRAEPGRARPHAGGLSRRPRRVDVEVSPR